MNIRYTAIRSLITSESPVHAAGTQYNFSVNMVEKEPSRKPVSYQARSLSGLQATTYYRTDEEWSCQTVPVTGGDLADMREFLSSVEAGERFECDPNGSYEFFVLSGEWRESRAVRRGDGGSGDYFTFRWTMRAL